jgi:hypothetical protein
MATQAQGGDGPPPTALKDEEKLRRYGWVGASGAMFGNLPAGGQEPNGIAPLYVAVTRYAGWYPGDRTVRVLSLDLHEIGEYPAKDPAEASRILAREGYVPIGTWSASGLGVHWIDLAQREG